MIELVREKESWEMSSAEKLEACTVRREAGNLFFKQGKFKLAIKRYKNAIECVQYDHNFNDAEKGQGKKLKLPCYLNIAASYTQLRDIKAVIDNCNKALEIEKMNVKALYRRAQAQSELRDYDSALTDLKLALDVDPENSAVKIAMSNVNKMLSEQEKKDKLIYGRMFQLDNERK